MTVPDGLGFLEQVVEFLHAGACGQGWAAGHCCPQPPVSGVLFCGSTLESTYFCVVNKNCCHLGGLAPGTQPLKSLRAPGEQWLAP